MMYREYNFDGNSSEALLINTRMKGAIIHVGENDHCTIWA